MSQSSTDEYSQSSSDGGYLASKIAAYQLSRSIDGFSHRPDTPLSDNALYSAALEAATEMRLRCGISSSCPAQLWTTHESTQSLRTDCPQVSEARIQFVEAMKSSWRPLGTDRIELPQEWISDSQQLKLGGDLSLSMLQIVTHPVRDALTPLSPHDRVPRMRKIAHCKPDFTYPRIPQGQWKADDPPDTAVSASRVLDVVTQFGDTRADRLDLCVASIFDGMPGFILRRNPVFCFYPCLGTSEDASIDYAAGPPCRDPEPSSPSTHIRIGSSFGGPFDFIEDGSH
ncbi:hypothetical protein PLICRDRAFT_375776 [Plicaturopsis crispa FD-325 SS-3]|uniref:Uncharacterized protein n=1 Tax=Plicaturopsis crispa FD-325 SS-3 TaxID=944288 RepID=A0A0C9SXB4_PLICR|nr:hypothetical protein PLICRDRAFT_375776 [Plicaturopsis crispa FD-325 SS-3]